MVTSSPIDNREDIIDSRDVLARIEALQAELAECEHDVPGNNREDCDLWDEHDELSALTALADEAEGSPDWRHGEALIRDSYFREYAEELARDCGMIQSDLEGRWPYNHIDWEAAAEELKQDYLNVDFDGVTYWIRG